MARPSLRVEVSAKDQKELRRLVSGGVQQVRVVLRALTPQAIRKVGHRYLEGGLERALFEKQRPGAAEVMDDGQKQRLIAMV